MFCQRVLFPWANLLTLKLTGILPTVEKVKFITVGYEYPMVRTFMVCQYPSAIHFYELHEEGVWFKAEKAGAYHLKEISEGCAAIADL